VVVVDCVTENANVGARGKALPAADPNASRKDFAKFPPRLAKGALLYQGRREDRRRTEDLDLLGLLPLRRIWGELRVAIAEGLGILHKREDGGSDGGCGCA